MRAARHLPRSSSSALKSAPQQSRTSRSLKRSPLQRPIAVFSESRSLSTTRAADGAPPPPASVRTRPSRTACAEPKAAASEGYLAWSTSPVNTGNPFHEEDRITAEVPPLKTIDDLLASAWSTSPVNTGDIIPDHFLSQSIAITTASSQIIASTARAMASDEDYAAFLDKASADRQAPVETQSKVASKGAQHRTVTTASVPDVLKINATYESDADEPFQPVSLHRTDGKGPLKAKEVKELVGAQGSVQEISTKDFDPKGDYKHVLKAVQQAVGTNDGITAWKIELSGARCEYWILGVKEDTNQVLGLKALSVES